MDFRQPKQTVASGPEILGARRLIRHMRARLWNIKKLHGGIYSIGWPDYYAKHRQHGYRWIETKAPGEKLRESQINWCKEMSRYGELIFVCHNEEDYRLLFMTNSEGTLIDNWRKFV